MLETKVILEGITVGGKVLQEHFKTINHRNAIYYVEDIIRKEEPFSEWQIRNIHHLILKNIDDDNAGRYRQQNLLISGVRLPHQRDIIKSMLLINFPFRIHTIQSDNRHEFQSKSYWHLNDLAIHHRYIKS